MTVVCVCCPPAPVTPRGSELGAMRPADAVGSDGLRNFANAVQVAANPEAAGRGVLP